MRCKIVDVKTLLQHLEIARMRNKKIVFTNGCFDLIHLGHVDYLSKARDLGDLLVVGVNTDSSVRRLKGESRPLQDEHSRTQILASFSFVDYVVLFDEDTPLELIKSVKPDILVKGADYKPENIVGYDVVNAGNGEIITIEFLSGYSTTNIINKVLHPNK
ncbi:MAG: D-glycero-beta-D-manno-heptose 1-phosphate adenylyltransferase [Bacteroidales bacterium]|nr:D-glycero-beta-D-manno-heptose 1-phosphate adenylyltransferase [Bacteroidales bacterium]